MADNLVTWSDAFLVGDKLVDSQHKELIGMINDFYAGVQMGGVMAKVYFLQTIKGATNYVKTHFASEEELMQRIKYPLFKEHKKLHEGFIAEVTKQVKIFEKDTNPDPAGYVKYLMNWVLNHVAESDKKFSPYLKPDPRPDTETDAEPAAKALTVERRMLVVNGFFENGVFIPEKPIPGNIIKGRRKAVLRIEY